MSSSPHKEITLLDIPIALFCFNRPYLLVQVLDALKTQTLFPQIIIAFLDGPRNEHDEAAVNECFELLSAFQHCPIKIIQREENYGCEKNIIGGIDDILQHYEAVVVLEDDTVPSAHFYKAMAGALTHHHDNPRIAAICGLNVFRDSCNQLQGHNKFVSKIDSAEEELIESQLYTCTGWGTWQRHWQQNRATLLSPHTLWQLFQIPLKPYFYHYYRHILNIIIGTVQNEWSYKFRLTLFQSKTRVLTFRQTLIKNVGFMDAKSVHGPGTQESEHAHNHYFFPDYAPSNYNAHQFTFTDAYHFYYFPLHCLKKLCLFFKQPSS